MAEEFQIGGGSWWDSSRNRFESGAPPLSASSSAALNSLGSLGWPMDVANLDFKTRSCNFMDSVPVSISVSSNSMAYQDTQNLQMVGLGLSSHPMDWNQTISLRGGGKPETSFQSGLQQNLSSAANFPPEIGMVDTWRQKLYSSNISDQSNEYKQFSPNISSSFQIDPAAAYTTPSSSQGILLGSENQLQRPNFLYPENYTLNYSAELSPSSSKFPRFLQNPPPKQSPINPFQFSNNNGTLWSTTSESMNDVRSSSFLSPPTFDEKPKNKSEVRDFGKVTKKSSSEASNKRSRSETSSPLPPFKVRKEKMGDKITALQQLVSPFGKTDTASVLSEAIEYIKFLHEQVNVFSKPYMKSGAPIQHHQSFEKPKDFEGPKQNLRSRGLCLVPISSTFPVTHETTIDFWTPTFGGTLR